MAAPLPRRRIARTPRPSHAAPLRVARQPDAAETHTEASAPAARAPSKIDQVLALLRREEGATLADLTAATGWLPHTTRAALTGLRKKHRAIARTKRDDVTCYKLAGAA